MRNDLHRPTQIVSLALLLNDGVIYLPGRKIIIMAKLCMGESFIVPQIEVCLGTVVGDKHLTVLEGIHGAGIDVDIGIQLLKGHRQAPAFQQRTDGSRSQSLSRAKMKTPPVTKINFVSYPIKKPQPFFFSPDMPELMDCE
jgi:hypothetical protein